MREGGVGYPLLIVVADLLISFSSCTMFLLATYPSLGPSQFFLLLCARGMFVSYSFLESDNHAHSATQSDSQSTPVISQSVYYVLNQSINHIVSPLISYSLIHSSNHLVDR